MEIERNSGDILDGTAVDGGQLNAYIRQDRAPNYH